MENIQAPNSVHEEEKNKEEAPTFSRRSFLKNTGIAFVLLFALGGAGAVVKGKTVLRPPGGQDEEALLAKCLKCDRCRSVCPTSVISPATLTAGIVAARTPAMDFRRGYCDFCNKCVEVCPTGALASFHPDTVRIGKAAVQRDICMAWVKGGCTICAEKCPYDAISLDEHRRPVVNEEKCNGCGVCEYECPVLILRSYIGGRDRGITVKPVDSAPPQVSLVKMINSLAGQGGISDA